MHGPLNVILVHEQPQSSVYLHIISPERTAKSQSGNQFCGNAADFKYLATFLKYKFYFQAEIRGRLN